MDQKRIRKRIADNIRKLYVFTQIHILTKVDESKKVELEQKFVKTYCKEYPTFDTLYASTYSIVTTLNFTFFRYFILQTTHDNGATK